MIRLSMLTATALAALMAAPVPAVAAGDYVCQANLYGKKARLWFQNDKPVQYKWSNRPEYAAQMSGDVITIKASPNATLSNVVVGENSKGQKTIKGDWKFKSNRKGGVVFTCK